MLRLLTISMWVVYFACQLTKGFHLVYNENLINTQKIEGEPVEANDESFENIEKIGSMTFENFTVGELIDAMEKRQNHHLQHGCGCPIYQENIEFKYGTFPRFFRATKCKKNANTHNICHYGFECKEFKHPIKVLKAKISSDFDDKIVHDLPHDLRSGYYWHNEEVSIDCRCSK